MAKRPHVHLSLNPSASDQKSGHFEFLREQTLSAGIYILEPNETDTQKPHQEDEIYYVLEGTASMLVYEEILQVKQGDFIFVPAYADHRFMDITERLRLLVFFSRMPVDPA